MNSNLTTRRTPTSIWDFMSEMDRVFDEAWRPTGEKTRSLPNFQPQVDVRETNDSYLIAVDLPGVSRSQIKVDYANGRLSISGERTQTEKTDKDKVHRVERYHGRFERSFQFPTDVIEDQIQARFEDGVLEVLVPKAQPSKGRSVAIESDKKGLFSKLLGSNKSEAKTQEPH